MAYLKYKELTKYFNFNEELDPKELPEFAMDYLAKGEEIYAVYRTRKDKAIFTEDRMILFDVLPWTNMSKKIHMIPYKAISTSAIVFHPKTAAILLSLDSGYQMRLNFVSMDPHAKTRLRLLYSYIMNSNRK